MERVPGGRRIRRRHAVNLHYRLQCRLVSYQTVTVQLQAAAIHDTRYTLQRIRRTLDDRAPHRQATQRSREKARESESERGSTGGSIWSGSRAPSRASARIDFPIQFGS